MRAHLFIILLICALIDAIFIFASVWGLQALAGWFPWLTGAILWFGVAFLAWYALQSARRALRPESGLTAARHAVPSRRAAVLGAVRSEERRVGTDVFERVDLVGARLVKKNK